MYQSIDSDIPDDAAADTSAAKAWLWPSVLVAGALIALVVWLYASSLGGTVGQSDPISPEPEARTTYLRALAETDPALRRARLTDFLSQYPENPRDGAVRAQLNILDAAADRDWQATLTIAYDPRFEIDARRSAVAAYQRQWGRYLGARDTEIETLLTEIETMPVGDDIPDRTLPRDPDAYRGIPNDRLAGDRFGIEPSIIFRPSSENREVSRNLTGDIIGPRVRRNATPRYPRRAQRRGIEATVTLSLLISETGRVESVELIEVDAPRYADDFVKEAERAALRTRFNPRTVGGIPVETDGIRKRYRFELGD
ncbi:MAG: energy transducer TonB [Litorimonas sp.]